ncbi:MAG TPA: 8-oxo-dGTP diphosphatase MutT [Tepidisphaeraceae bacterium]|nr:8-oxo-dGTP diphosphatase MutT [Tepidisphaeraceae bacterium]
MKRIDVAIAIIVNDQHLLICRRKADDSFAGYWEFPGGKVEKGESPTDCLARELREELDIQAEIIETFTTIQHNYPNTRVRLHPFLCRQTSGELKPLECDQAIWIRPQDLKKYRFPEANDDLIRQIIQRLTAE